MSAQRPWASLCQWSELDGGQNCPFSPQCPLGELQLHQVTTTRKGGSTWRDLARYQEQGVEPVGQFKLG
jgi:hypothetical protein